MKAGNLNHQGILPKRFFKNMLQTTYFLAQNPLLAFHEIRVKSKALSYLVFCPCMIWPHWNVFSMLETGKCLDTTEHRKKGNTSLLNICWSPSPSCVCTCLHLFSIISCSPATPPSLTSIQGTGFLDVSWTC